MSQASRSKDKTMAASMKKFGIKRDSGKCPRGCGALVKNGGSPLLDHLKTCLGPRR